MRVFKGDEWNVEELDGRPAGKRDEGDFPCIGLLIAEATGDQCPVGRDGRKSRPRKTRLLLGELRRLAAINGYFPNAAPAESVLDHPLPVGRRL